MKVYAPSYYGKFKCIADKCRHSCCVGWEIDIDEKTVGEYKRVGGAIGEKLAANISMSDGAYFFTLCEDERCPFLTEKGLCEIINELGEEHLCAICAEHPRFYNYPGGREERGLGLCCEAAAELVLSQTEPFSLELISDDGLDGGTDEFSDFDVLGAREELLSVLLERKASITDRLAHIEEKYRIKYRKSIPALMRFMATLEVLDSTWRELLLVAARYLEGNNVHSTVLDAPLEQFAAYIAYRHLAVASDDVDFFARVGFLCASVRIVAAIATYKGGGEEPSFEAFADIARMYSAEIEYSEDNTEALIAEFYPDEARNDYG